MTLVSQWTVMMKPLIDGDILRYEIGFAVETGWIGSTEGEIPPWWYVEEFFDMRVAQICANVGATEEPVLYISEGENFRHDIAKTKPYKGNRQTDKPWHYNNLTAYITGAFNHVVCVGIEADDQMCIDQTDDTIICSRDKDLRQCPGWHFGWELGNMAAFGPEKVDEFGRLWWDVMPSGKKKLRGTGFKFFCSQLLTGDGVDNIPGLPKYGPVKAFDILDGTKTPEECFMAVTAHYKDSQGPSWADYMLEQGQLLWLVRELVDGEPVMWEIPYTVGPPTKGNQ